MKQVHIQDDTHQALRIAAGSRGRKIGEIADAAIRKAVARFIPEANEKPPTSKKPKP